MPMVRSPFNGQLNVNKLTASLYNMIVDQICFDNGIKAGFGLADLFRTEGSLYGDTILFTSTDILRVSDWGADAEAGNLLQLDKPIKPKVQAVVMDTYKQIRVSLDEFLSKQAWLNQGIWNSFRSTMLGWLYKTKEVSDNTLINAYVGTTVASSTVNTVAVSGLVAAPSTVADYQLNGMLIGKALADLFVDLKDYSRKYNDNGFIRNYDPNEFVVVWNSDYINAIEHVSLPNIFHDSKVFSDFTKYVLPSKYFGTKGASAVAAASVTANTYRSLIECDYVTNTTVGSAVEHVRPGDYIPAGGKKLTAGQVILNTNQDGYVLGTTGTATNGIAAGEYYTNDSTNVCICKVVHRDAVKYMSAFMVTTEFFNSRSLNDSHFVTYGFGLDRVKEVPFIKITN